MLSDTVQDALNDQIQMEFSSSYSYLAMAAYCERKSFLGAAKWLRIQSQEEYAHGMKLYNFMLARNCNVQLKALPAPQADYDSVVDVFRTSLAQETEVSRRIDTLYELAFTEKAFAALVELQWFISEQVEEEHTAGQIVAKFELVKDDPPAMLDLDRELGERSVAGTRPPEPA
jgi:ferritin